jgi:Ulp1 family protease
MYHRWLCLAQSLPGDNELLRSGFNVVTVADAASLKPKEWLVNSILHYFTKTCKRTFKNKSSVLVLFSSYFLSLLFNEGHADLEGKFSYRNIKTWATKH